MARLLLRYDDGEHVLRSVDETPGIVGAGLISEHGPWGIYVDPFFVPSERGKAAREKVAGMPGVIGAAIMEDTTAERDSSALTALSAADVVAACEGERELVALISIVDSMMLMAWTNHAQSRNWDGHAKAARGAERIMRATAARLRELHP